MKSIYSVLFWLKIALPNGKRIRYGYTHLEAYNKISRNLQIKEIRRIAAEISLPFIVAGDFNQPKAAM